MAATCVYSFCRNGVEDFDIVSRNGNGTHFHQFVMFLDSPTEEKTVAARMSDLKLLFITVARHFRNAKHKTPIVLMTSEMHAIPEPFVHDIEKGGQLVNQDKGKLPGLMVTFRVLHACLVGNFKQVLRTLLMDGVYATPNIAESWPTKVQPFTVHLCQLLELSYSSDVTDLSVAEKALKLALEASEGGKFMNREEICIKFWEEQQLLCAGEKPKAGDRHFNPKPLALQRVKQINDTLQAVATTNSETLSVADATALTLGACGAELVEFRAPRMQLAKQLATQKVGVLTDILGTELKEIEKNLKMKKGFVFVELTDPNVGDTFEKVSALLKKLPPNERNRMQSKGDYRDLLMNLSCTTQSLSTGSVDGATELGENEDPVYTVDQKPKFDAVSTSETDTILEALNTGAEDDFYSKIIDLGSFDGIVVGDRTDKQLFESLMSIDHHTKVVMNLRNNFKDFVRFCMATAHFPETKLYLMGHVTELMATKARKARAEYVPCPLPGFSIFRSAPQSYTQAVAVIVTNYKTEIVYAGLLVKYLEKYSAHQHDRSNTDLVKELCSTYLAISKSEMAPAAANYYKRTYNIYIMPVFKYIFGKDAPEYKAEFAGYLGAMLCKQCKSKQSLESEYGYSNCFDKENFCGYTCYFNHFHKKCGAVLPNGDFCLEPVLTDATFDTFQCRLGHQNMRLFVPMISEGGSAFFASETCSRGAAAIYKKLNVPRVDPSSQSASSASSSGPSSRAAAKAVPKKRRRGQ
jgi:hypothetical protein